MMQDALSGKLQFNKMFFCKHLLIIIINSQQINIYKGFTDFFER